MKRYLLILSAACFLLAGYVAHGATVIVKISQFPNTAAPAGSDLFLLASGSTNKNIRYDQLRNQLIGSSTNFGTTIYTTNASMQYVTNDYTYTTNLYTTNALILYLTNSFLLTTNLYATNSFILYLTNGYVYTTNLYVTNASILYLTNSYTITTNLYATNSYIEYLTNNYLITTNLLAGDTYTTNLYTTNFYAGDSYLSNAYITNLNVKSLTLIQGLYYSTNLWSGPTNTLPLFLPRQWYATYVPVSVTGYTGKSNNFTSAVLLTITNASDSNVLITLPVATMTGNWTNQYTISNASTAKIWFEYDPGAGDTNAVFRQMK